MLDIFIAIAAAGSAQAAEPAAAAPQRPLNQIPGVTVNYYDVTGKNAKDFRKSIAAQRPAGADGLPVTVGSKWTINAAVSKRTEGEVCTIENANATFTGTVELPRLATTEGVAPQELANWNQYAASLEAEAAARLGFVQSQVGAVEQAIEAASCDGASAALDAATARVKAQENELAAQRAAAAAAQAEAQPKPKRQRRDLYRGTTEDARDTDNPRGY